MCADSTSQVKVLTCKFLEQHWGAQGLPLYTDYFYSNTQKCAFISHRGVITDI